MIELPLDQDDPVWPAAFRSVDGSDTPALGAHADLGILLHLDFGDHPAHRRIRSDDVNFRSLANQAAPSIAAHEVLRSQCRVVRQLDIDPGFILSEALDPQAAEDRHPELIDPASQDGLEDALPQRKQVVVAGREVTDVQANTAESHRGVLLSLRQEAIGDTALIEHFEGARA